MQEDKPPVFDAFDTVDACLEVLAGSIASARFDAARMRRALAEGFVDATELADYLAAKGVPFRHAHHVAGRLVKRALDRGVTLADLSLAELQSEHEAFADDIYAALDPETAVERRNLPGGPARSMVLAELRQYEARLAERQLNLDAISQKYGVRTEP
jgi:argininosuccinate lyase